ncbi:MAG: PqqD family peptide modification chaperone [Cyanobacteria bacterium J06634_6]
MAPTLSTFTADTVISPVENQISSELAGEAVILNLDSGMYYGLNEVGARIWEIIQQHSVFSEVHHILLEEYDVSSEACSQALTDILSELQRVGLVEVHNETI